MAGDASCISMRAVAFGMGIAHSPTAGETSWVGLGKASWVIFGLGLLIAPGETSWVSFGQVAFGVGSGCMPMVSEIYSGRLRWLVMPVVLTSRGMLLVQVGLAFLLVASVLLGGVSCVILVAVEHVACLEQLVLVQVTSGLLRCAHGLGCWVLQQMALLVLLALFSTFSLCLLVLEGRC